LNLTKKFLACGVNPNGTDFEGNTPLHLVFSLFKRDPETAKEIAEELLANGADPNALSKEFWAPLH
jgi:ankyrin repeat protein